MTITKITAAILILIIAFFFSACSQNAKENTESSSLFQYNENIEPRWSSPENMNGIKGAGGKMI